jgi:hypothetical protein
MTVTGWNQVRGIKTFFFTLLRSEYPLEVHCGTGRRQWQVAQALGLDNHRERLHISSLWGDASTLVYDNGVKRVLLSHGEIIEYGLYDTAKHIGGEIIRGVVRALPHDSVICSGRPVLVRLGKKVEDCLNGALYAINVEDTGEIRIEAKTSGINLLLRTVLPAG